MIKNIDILSYNIDHLIYRFFVQAYHMRVNDIDQHPFDYSYDIYFTCANTPRVTTSDIISVTNSYSFFLPLPTLQFISPLTFLYNITPYLHLHSLFLILLFNLKKHFGYLSILLLLHSARYSLLYQEVPLFIIFSK